MNVRLPSELEVAKSELKRQMKQQQVLFDDRISRLEQKMDEQEANSKRDHEAVMAALAAIRGLPAADQGGDGGGP